MVSAVLKNWRTWALFLTIFSINFLFKLINISIPSFWYDEIISVKDTLLDFGHIKHEAEWDSNPPFYYYALWTWAKLFGISEFAIRSMSAFFSALTAVLLFSFIRKLKDNVTAICSIAIFTFHPYLIYYAQEARCYSLLIFIVSLNIYVLFNFVKKPDLLNSILLGLMNFLVFYTHYLAGLILMLQFFYVLFFVSGKFKFKTIAYLVPILLVYVRFTKKQFIYLFNFKQAAKEAANIILSDLAGLKECMVNIFVSEYVFLLLLVLIVIYLYKNIAEKKEPDSVSRFKLFVILMPFLSIFTLYALGKFTNVFNARYLIFVIPYVIISFSFLFDKRIILYVVTATIILFEIPKIKLGQSKKMDFKTCSYIANELKKKEDFDIVVQTHDVIGLFLYYYDIELFKIRNTPADVMNKKNIYFINNVNDLNNLDRNKDRPVLLLQTFHLKEDEILIEKSFADHKIFSTNQIEGVRLSYYCK